MTLAALRPETAGELADAVRSAPRIVARGGGTKSALSRPWDAGVRALELGALRGITDYDPGEYTFTARAGTPLAEIDAALAAHGQHLPFDPPFAARGATLGGTIAAGLSGPSRLRHGGVRDFLLAVRFVDGEGRVLAGGARVVKNAAGFDFPKLFAGSLGELGVITEATLKVFPRAATTRTLGVECGGLDLALALLGRLAASSLELLALDLVPPARLELRVGAAEVAIDGRIERVRAFVEAAHAASAARVECTVMDNDSAHWVAARDASWAPADATLVKVPLDPTRVGAFERALAGVAAPRRYGAAAAVAWIAWPATEPIAKLERALAVVAAPALVVRAPAPVARPLLGVAPNAFLERIRSALDPLGRFRRGDSPEPC